MNPWDRDVNYDSETVARIVNAGTDLKTESVQFLGEGFDNSVFLINGTHVFRFVRRQKALNYLKYELIALPLMPLDLPLQIPRPLYKGVYDGNWLWAGYRFFQGKPIYELGLGDESRRNAASAIARFLRALHGQDPEPFRSGGVPSDWLGHMDLVKRIPFANEKLEKLVGAKIIAPKPEYQEIIEAAKKVSLSHSPVLVHGDFKATHILFHGLVPSAVIDWGDVHIGHPATDLSIAYTFFPPRMRGVFWREYGFVSEELKTLARFRALFHTLAILEYAASEKLELIHAEAMRALNWTITA
jgi:aminoglycoside phosphotransferase (APT) family kinase protein